ncbi:MAG: sugar transferase [Clostridia bacterium]|nr:sugar transferase [Clostridia bacterium]
MYAVIKRILEFLLSLFALILLSPVITAISLAIRLDSKGPVIFKQLRTGKYGKPFKAWKFRTMIADNDVHDFSTSDQHTKIGTFLRKTSLDELPQLFNVLSGKMSFIGPRPWITDYYELMNEEQRHRVDVTPGITGLAQAKGRNNLSIFEKIGYDLEYIDNYSLIEDLKVVLLTVKAVFSSEGADAGKSTIQNELDELRAQWKKEPAEEK